MNEFEIIERFFAPLGLTSSTCFTQGNGDDCAVVNVPSGHSLCVSIDTLVEGVHFPRHAPADRLAHRALASAMSDLAAMGARPGFYTLALTLPGYDAQWLSQFSSGLKGLTDKYAFPLMGGDTTKGPLCISIQVHGWLSQTPLLRSGAKAGDLLIVSGTLGDAGAALNLLDQYASTPASLNADQHFLLDRYYAPEPRIELGLSLLGLASSCIDISDGLLAEAEHLAVASGVSIFLESARLPLSAALKSIVGDEGACALALTSGDDYELLFTMSPLKWAEFSKAYKGVLPAVIGYVESGKGVYLDGRPLMNQTKGYQHFE